MYFYVFFFFFQAEDGIRDIGVDWSSDVCSSDLYGLQTGGPKAEWPMTPLRVCPVLPRVVLYDHILAESGVAQPLGDPRQTRSEERRVGKECRSRWSPYH